MPNPEPNTGEPEVSVLDSRGVLTVLALDHRDSLRVEFDAENPDAVEASELTKFKQDVLDCFGSRPSGVMLDPEYSISQIWAKGRVAPGVGAFCALEAQGYLGDPDVVVNELMWTPAQAVEAKATAAKLLILYRPDRGKVTERQESLVTEVVADCAEVGLPLFVEPVPYEIADVDDREDVVVRSAERIGALGPDVIKMPFPSASDTPERWEAACSRLDSASDVPWAVLSWGARFEVFVGQVQAACDNGASGFMAGRAIWAEAVLAPNRGEVLNDVALGRFARLVDATSNARGIKL
jgi:tagatose 1,6-diphosphate aldolase